MILRGSNKGLECERGLICLSGDHYAQRCRLALVVDGNQVIQVIGRNFGQVDAKPAYPVSGNILEELVFVVVRINLEENGSAVVNRS